MPSAGAPAPHQLVAPFPTGPVCIACGERGRFRVILRGGAVEVRRREDCTRAMRLMRCGRCGSRHTIVLETTWE